MENIVACDWASPAFDRRRGPRRLVHDGPPLEERRQYDRRQRKPGLAALLGAILGPDLHPHSAGELV